MRRADHHRRPARRRPAAFSTCTIPPGCAGVDYTLGIMFLATLAAYAIIRVREIVNYRRNQAGR